MPKNFLPIEDVTLHIWIHFKINKLHNIISRSSQCDKCDKEKFHHAQSSEMSCKSVGK